MERLPENRMLATVTIAGGIGWIGLMMASLGYAWLSSQQRLDHAHLREVAAQAQAEAAQPAALHSEQASPSSGSVRSRWSLRSH
jgi:hypothetical protein